MSTLALMFSSGAELATGVASTLAPTLLVVALCDGRSQCTAEARRTDPTPTIAPVIVRVVDTGTPSAVARNSVSAPPVSAQKPPTGFSFVIFWPIVSTMRQPSNIVPSPIAMSQHRIVQAGGMLADAEAWPEAMSSI